MTKKSANERLASWMELMQLNDRQVAEATGVDLAHVWRIRKGKIVMPDSFAWKFGQAYGFDLARKLFDGAKETA